MASGGKRKTTMAKLTRESKLRERRLDKQARKEARKHAPPPDATDLSDAATGEGESPSPIDGPPAVEEVAQVLTDA